MLKKLISYFIPKKKSTSQFFTFNKSGKNNNRKIKLRTNNCKIKLFRKKIKISQKKLKNRIRMLAIYNNYVKNENDFDNIVSWIRARIREREKERVRERKPKLAIDQNLSLKAL